MFTKVNGVSEIFKIPVADAMDILYELGGVRTLPGCNFSTKAQVAGFFGITPEALTAVLGQYGFSANRVQRHIRRISCYTEVKRLIPNAEFLLSEDGKQQVCLNVDGVHKCEVLPSGQFNLYSPNAVLAIAAILHDRKEFNIVAHDVVGRVFHYLDEKTPVVSEPELIAPVSYDLIADIVSSAVAESVKAVFARLIRPGAKLSV